MPPKRKLTELDDSDEEEPSLGKQVLPVANLPANFDGIPEDGMQYLFTVRCVQYLRFLEACLYLNALGGMLVYYRMLLEQ